MPNGNIDHKCSTVRHTALSWRVAYGDYSFFQLIVIRHLVFLCAVLDSFV